MPRAKSKTKIIEDKVLNRANLLNNLKTYQKDKRAWIIILLLGLALLAYYKKGWFVAATVNNQPITSIELNQRLNKMYKDQTLNQMINEKILEQEAAKKGINITQEEIDTKISELENQYGGKEIFESLLMQQGLSRDEFERQTKFQLIIERLYSSEVSPSAEEIQKFMEENIDSPEATEPAKFRQTAETSLRQQKLSTIFNQKFQELKQAAKVQIF